MVPGFDPRMQLLRGDVVRFRWLRYTCVNAFRRIDSVVMSVVVAKSWLS